MTEELALIYTNHVFPHLKESAQFKRKTIQFVKNVAV